MWQLRLAMEARWIVGAVGMIIMGSLGACSMTADEAVGGDSARVREAEFDKDTLLTDKALRDTDALTAADIQAFLDETPWGDASVLANYDEDGRSAAEIMHDAAAKHGINPLELLVRLQMEQGLIAKTTASDEAISLAFGCGCPHSPVCSPKYEGFANQAECAAGTLSRSMDRALTSKGTVSGWKRGEEKLTQDRIEIVPTNAATAALYTYTPWVGEAGGGKKGVGGASLHHAIWTGFAEAIGYGVTANASNASSAPSERLDAGIDAQEELEEEPNEVHIEAGAGEVDAGPQQEEPRGSDEDAGPAADYETGDDDEDILSEGNAPPTTNAPPPRQSGSRSRVSRDDRVEATEEELSAGKKKGSDGCSTSGGRASDAPLAALAFAVAGLAATRRRRQA